jgi:hypothetical protein
VKLNVLVLLNNGPFAPLFKEVVKQLRAHGANVVVATDCDYSRELLQLDELGCRVYSFSDFLLAHQANAVSSSAKTDAWALYPDFDRGTYFGFARKLSGQNARRICAALDGFFSALIEREEISEVFYENVSNGFAAAAMRAVEAVAGRYHGYTSSRLPGMACFSRFETDVRDGIAAEAASVFEAIELHWAEKYISNLTSTQPDYMFNNPLNRVGEWKRSFRLRSLRNVGLLVKHSLPRNTRLQCQMAPPLLQGLNTNVRLLKRRIKRGLIGKYYSQPPADVVKYLYPLHYHPEASTSVGAKYFDEYNTIKNIAFSLHDDEWLVVKDHVSATGFESVDFYRRVARLPNVTLLDPYVNAKSFLAEECAGVFTLTSTVGYEAVLLGLPVVVFGDVFYEAHASVFKPVGFQDLPRALDHLRQRRIAPEISCYNTRFVAAYRRACFETGGPQVGDLRERAVRIVENMLSRRSDSSTREQAPPARAEGGSIAEYLA